MPDDLKALADHKWVKIGALAGVGVLVLTVVLFMRGGGGGGGGSAAPGPSPTDLTGIGSELSQIATGQAQILDMLGGSVTSTLPATGNGDPAAGPAPQLNPVVPPVHPFHWREIGPAVMFEPPPAGGWRPR